MKKHKGRPTKYTPEKISELAQSLLQWTTKKFQKEEVFWFKNWAIENGFTWQRVSEFAEKSEEFSDALKKAKEMQEAVLVRAGVNAKGNVAFIIFALKNIFGWRDTAGEDDKEISNGFTIIIGKPKKETEREQ